MQEVSYRLLSISVLRSRSHRFRLKFTLPLKRCAVGILWCVITVNILRQLGDWCSLKMYMCRRKMHILSIESPTQILKILQYLCLLKYVLKAKSQNIIFCCTHLVLSKLKKNTWLWCFLLFLFRINLWYAVHFSTYTCLVKNFINGPW